MVVGAIWCASLIASIGMLVFPIISWHDRLVQQAAEADRRNRPLRGEILVITAYLVILATCAVLLPVWVAQVAILIEFLIYLAIRSLPCRSDIVLIWRSQKEPNAFHSIHSRLFELAIVVFVVSTVFNLTLLANGDSTGLVGSSRHWQAA